MFTLLGTLLAVFGLIRDKSVFQRSLGINVDLGWGLVMLVFGVVMFVLATAQLAEESSEGKKIEEIEHNAGLEK